MAERADPQEVIERTPGLTVLFHQIRYDSNNHGISSEDLTNYTYLRIFEHMGEELAIYDEARQKHKAFDNERREKLRNFGSNGFRIVMEAAQRVARITPEELAPVSREDSRGGLNRYISLAPFIEGLEKGPQHPTESDRQALKTYLSVLNEKLPMYRVLASPKSISAR